MAAMVVIQVVGFLEYLVGMAEAVEGAEVVGTVGAAAAAAAAKLHHPRIVRVPISYGDTESPSKAPPWTMANLCTTPARCYSQDESG